MVTVLVSAIRFMTGPSCAEAVQGRTPTATEAIKAKSARFIKMPFFSDAGWFLDAKNWAHGKRLARTVNGAGGVRFAWNAAPQQRVFGKCRLVAKEQAKYRARLSGIRAGIEVGPAACGDVLQQCSSLSHSAAGSSAQGPTTGQNGFNQGNEPVDLPVLRWCDEAQAATPLGTIRSESATGQAKTIGIPISPIRGSVWRLGCG